MRLLIVAIMCWAFGGVLVLLGAMSGLQRHTRDAFEMGGAATVVFIVALFLTRKAVR
jgi:hypothetical protein